VNIPEELKDFRNFVYLVWEHLGLPEPTPVQYDIAKYLQHGERRQIVLAYRGVGKSYLTSAYVVWSLLLNPALNILVVSASKARADDFSTFTQRLINEMPLLQHLKARPDQRDSKIAFDVAPAPAAHAPSVKSVGITGQITGSRADIIVADDVESLGNSETQGMRDKLANLVKEFDSVLKPEGQIKYLGTYQTEMSLYKVLPERGYIPRVWTGRYPTEKKVPIYGDSLAPFILKTITDDPSLENQPVDPKRFDEDDLVERELSYGRSGFALQFMLDPSLSDADRYPLKLKDFIVMDIDIEKAPEKVIHSSSPEKILKDLPSVGFSGDYFHMPQAIDGDWIPYRGTVMTIDPSGRGQDETGYCIMSMLNGYLYVHECSGISGGYTKEALTEIAELAKKYKVKEIQVESNFGDGMFNELLKPYLMKIYPVTLSEVRHSTQKERRIIETLEPLMNQHKIIVSPTLIESDYSSTKHLPPEKAPQYRLFHQLTRVTQSRGSLAHDDRLEVLAMAAHYWVEAVGQDADRRMQEDKEGRFQEELDRFMENAIGYSKPSNTWI
tara:strand:- start:4540 stop:6204 length:1665 start_codon:yes stop_codon:yes gene_type:complete